MALLLSLGGVDERLWQERLTRALGDYPVHRSDEMFDPAAIRYILAWKPGPDVFAKLSNLKAILSLGAGVDGLLSHPALPDVPIVRFVDEDLTRCMSDYVIAQVAMHQRLFSRYRADQRARVWSQLYPPASNRIAVGIMGMGVLGRDAARKLAAVGFTVNGWSRSARHVAGVTGFVGTDGFDAFLGATDILVNLLPLTPDTAGILNMATFQKLRRGPLVGGPAIVNAARGGHQVEADIVAALKDGTLGAASLDVFETEPLPPESPLWALETCYITPHIAAISNPDSGTAYFAEAIRDAEAGRPLRNVVDRARGY